MGCDEVQRRLSDYLDGELPYATRRRVAGHLDRCRQCGPVFRSLAQTVVGLRTLRFPQSGASSAPAVAARIQAEPRGRPARGIRWALRLCLRRESLRRSAAVAVVVGAVLTVVNQSDAIASGSLAWSTGARISANFVIPFVVSNLGLIAAARDRRLR